MMKNSYKITKFKESLHNGSFRRFIRVNAQYAALLTIYLLGGLVYLIFMLLEFTK